MSGRRSSWTPGDSSFLFIPCSSARLPPNWPWGQAAELTNAVPAAALLVSGFHCQTTHHRPAVHSLPQLAQGTHTRRVSIPVAVGCRDRDLLAGLGCAGLGRQQEAQGQICLGFGRVNRGVSLRKEKLSRGKGRETTGFPWALVHADIT